MDSLQSTLGEDDGIAGELAESQREISISEFFQKNRHMLGFDSEARALVTATKEAVDNSLDAAEEATILPDIYVEIREVGDYYRLVVEDNGPGITREQVPKIFGKLLYGSRFHKREQSLLPDQRILVRSGEDVELVEIGAFCDAFVGDHDGDATVPVEGVQAPCFDRESGEVNWHDVTHAIRHENRNDAYRVETTRGRSIEVTGNHSLFTLGSDGGIEEVAAATLEPGDSVVAPEEIPAPDDATSVNILEHVPRSELDDRRWFVYGIDETLIERILEEGERVRKYPSADSDRKRTYHVLDGVEVLRDSLKTNYLEKGYLPAEVVVDLGWEAEVSDCTIRTYQVGGDPDECPVTVSLTEEFARFLGLYVAEGHADERQVGFTFGSHEPEYVEEVVGTVGSVFAASATVEERPRNSTRVKAFGSPLTVFLTAVCGHGAEGKRVPGFIFRAPTEVRQAFIDALHDGDGSDSHPSNELVYSTISERLARELSYLWSMQGVAATWKERMSEDNIVGGTSEIYEVLIQREDLDASNRYEPVTDTRSAMYRRLPASVLADLAVDDCPTVTVPPTKTGVFLAAGFGSQLQYAEPFVERARTALDGETPEEDYYRETLEAHGFLTGEGEPTGKLRSLWDRCERLESFGESDLCLLQVESVEQIDAPEHVYDISVPGTGTDENFVAGNNGALCVKNSRGQQGIGISAAVLNSQLTSGQPAKITSRPKGSDEARYFELVIDTDENEPEIRVDEATTWDRPHGTRIELEMEANMRARQQLHDYVRHTAVVNPHARIELREPGLDEPLKFERATDQLPAETEEIRPHPHGVELGELLKMLAETSSYSLSGFLQEEFTRVGEKTADKVLAAFRDRHFGRAMTWRGPGPAGKGSETGVGGNAGVDVIGAVEAATANKSAEATTAFAEGVAGRLADYERVARADVASAVEAAAEGVESTHDERIGSTVRENAVDAVWAALTSVEEPDRLTPDLYALVDEATSVRKDDETVQRLAELLAVRFEGLEGDHRLTHEDLRRLVEEAADRTVETLEATIGDTARGNVIEALWERTRAVEDDLPKVKAVAGDRDVTRELLDAMRETDILSPPTGCLAPITANLVEAGLRKVFDADFYAAATRDAEVHGGDPFVVEAGIAYGGDLPAEGTVEVLRFANRVPLVYQRGACATTDVLKSIGWRNYGLDQPGGSGLPVGPAVVMVHVASTNVPFTSESKDALANVPAIEDEVELAVREAARELKSYLNRRRSLEKRREKQEVLGRILPEMADKVAEVTGRDRPAIDGALARIMNNLSVERSIDDETVTVTVENYTDREETLDVTEIVSVEPSLANGAEADAAVVDVDGEWFLQWTPTVAAGETAELSYTVPDGDDPEFDLQVDGVEDEKLTVNA
jgi:DNA topoisomerase-6 subunit B